jgi:hypothetical protein
MLALTTTLAFWIIDYDTASAWQIDCGKGVYYGISFWNQYMFIAARQAGVGANRDAQDNIILCYSDDLRLTRILKPPSAIRDVHQIAAADGVLYVVSSYDDQIACYDIETDDWTFWQPFTPYAGPGLDAYHINSVYVGASEILLAGLRPKGWAARFDRLTRKLISRQDLGRETHNVWLDGGAVHVCSSADSSILREDGQSYALLTYSWVRGCCGQGDRRFAGTSENLARANRAFSDCSVLEMDDHYRYVSTVRLRGFGMLLDLRSIDIPDPMTHNGQTFALQQSCLDQRFLKHTFARSAGQLRKELAADD